MQLLHGSAGIKITKELLSERWIIWKKNKLHKASIWSVVYKCWSEMDASVMWDKARSELEDDFHLRMTHVREELECETD